MSGNFIPTEVIKMIREFEKIDANNYSSYRDLQIDAVDLMYEIVDIMAGLK
jgi:hypothetical protein